MVNYTEYFEYLTDLSNGQDSVKVMGDFNLPDINWPILTGSMAMSYAFCDLVFDTQLRSLQPTHTHDNILDLILTNKDELISFLTVQSQSPLPDTDHYST